MALTLEREQALEGVSLVKFFEGSRAKWTRLARECYGFVKGHYPDGAAVRRDDVAEVIVPFLTVDKTLSKSLAEKSLKQKYWVSDFSDLILDRTWQEISK